MSVGEGEGRDAFRIHVDDVELAYDRHPVVAGVSFRIHHGEWVGLIGPNGSGKSTLIKAIGRVLAPRRGSVTVDDRRVQHYRPAALARKVAVVTQESPMPFDFTVRDVVAMGRIPHLGRFQPEGPRDVQAVERALRLTGTDRFAHRLANELSGGERQRVVIARALAQEPAILLLDEPTAHLDIGCQTEILDLLARLVEDEQLTVLSVLHDLNSAAQYCDRLILLNEGRVRAAGPPEHVVTEPLIGEVYGVPVRIARHPVTQTPCVHLIPETRRKRRPKAAAIPALLLALGFLLAWAGYPDAPAAAAVPASVAVPDALAAAAGPTAAADEAASAYGVTAAEPGEVAQPVAAADAAAITDAGFPFTFHDSLGHRVTIPAKPGRIVTVGPSLTEMVFALGAGSLVVGVDEFSDFPEEVGAVPTVGGLVNPSADRIVALTPDLVLLDEIAGVQHQRLTNLGLTVALLSPRDVEAVMDTILLLGRALGEEEAAQTIVRDMEGRMASVRQVTGSIPEERRVTVFHEIWPEPVYTAGPGSFIHELIERAGGRNVAGDVDAPWVQWSLEALLAADPEVILTTREAYRDDLLKGRRPRWRGIRAVKEGRVCLVDEDEISRPGPRIVAGLEAIARCLYPEWYGGAQ